MKNIKLLVIIFLLGFIGAIESQERPPIEVYTPKTYDAENQNWAISQSDDKFIYIANSKGLLEFNGAEWNLYPDPNESIMRSVNVIDNLIYTGSYREFGYWQKNEFGTLYYTSLSQKLKIQFLEDEEIWTIINIDDYLLFQSLKRIYIYSKLDASYTIVNSNTTIYKMLKIEDSIYFQKDSDGIYKIENGAPKLISNHPILREEKLVNIFKQSNHLLIETENEGFYILKNGTLSKWNVSINNEIAKYSVYRSIRLQDNSFVLGTRSSGILHVVPKGNDNYEINSIEGLSNNTVLSIFEDRENNIWLGLQNGINCVNIKSPFSIYNDDDDKIGEVYASIIFRNNLYLGTNRGLFFRPFGSKDEFSLIEGTQGQVWSLIEIDNTLFCAHDFGTFIINQNSAEKIKDTSGTWNIVSIQGEEDMLLEGNYNGLDIIEKQNNTWVFKNKIEGFEISSRFFEEYSENELLVSHEHRGVFDVTLNSDYTKAIKVVRDSIIGSGPKSSIIKYNDDIVYARSEGVFKYNLMDNRFFKDTLLSVLIKRDEYISGKLNHNKKTNVLWAFSKKNLNYISTNNLSATPKLNRVSFSESFPRVSTGNENIYHLNNQKYLIGISTGYLILDLDKIVNKTYEVRINSITKSDLKNSSQTIDKSSKLAFENTFNNVELSYSVAEYDKYLDTEYQYQLEGMYPQWSKWSSTPKALFKNLPFGNYTFNVKARVGNIITNNVASYSFEIQRPLHLSNTMIVLYAFVVILLSMILHNVYKRYYKTQREKLIQKTVKELELKELENKQQLMFFNNEKLRQDIDNKNRELGISTMSLIKKNEFLNNIKNELKNLNDNKDLKHIVKIIDRHINNTDDWHVFEEAFNNADKDFLKKIKEEHPALTSNDLRLCAYLRLNLSSKEIAPLLNISPRSVEVKRYRLRKKIGLQHESSLTDYILQI